MVGAALFFIYLTIFYIITVNKRQFLKQFVVTLIIITLASFYDKYEPDSVKASQTIGRKILILQISQNFNIISNYF